MTGLAESFVVFPGTCPTQTIKEGFYNMAGIDIECCSYDVHCCIINAAYYFIGFPRVLGCIDCTHIPISACLGENEVTMCLITSLEAKWPGSVYDSRIFSESSLCHKLEQGMETVHSYCFVRLKLPVYFYGNLPLSSGLFSGVLLEDRAAATRVSRDPPFHPYHQWPTLIVAEGQLLGR
ncbi:hypothetical protein F7725_007021, partial [Dissostichus mawsoni]